MDQAYFYIKKLIAVLLSFFVMAVVFSWFTSINIISPSLVHELGSGMGTGWAFVFALMAGFLVLSFLHFKLTGIKPSYLYGMKKADDHLNKKGGFWLLFKWIFSLFGFVYDLIIWSVNGVYALFLIIIDFLLLIKTIAYWIIHAIIWFLRLFVPPIIFLYRMFIYYIIRWPWRIYKLTFRNIKISINKNFFYISLWGAVLGIFLISLFYGLGRLVGIDGVVFVGAVFAVLPLVWSYAEISALRNEQRCNDDLDSIRMSFDNGFEAVKAVSFYMVIFLVGIIAEILLSLMGWIPNIGFSLLGISLNLSTFISIVLIFVFVILVFAKVLMPAHIVHNPGYESNLESSGKFLEVIGKKFLRYIVSHIPGSFFAGVLTIIPALIVLFAISMTMELKDSIMDSRIETLEARTYTIELKDKYILEERINRFEYYKSFPMNVIDDFINIKDYSDRKEIVKMNIEGLKKEVIRIDKIFKAEMDSLNFVVQHLTSQGSQDSYVLLTNSQQKLENKKEDYEIWMADKLDQELKMTAELMYVKGMIYQLPIAFLFVIIWISLFGGLILAVIISYFGNVYHELYAFGENEEPTYFKQISSELNAKDNNQPLLGFTLIGLLVVIPLIIELDLVSYILRIFT